MTRTAAAGPPATGVRHRERRKLPDNWSRTTAREWAERRERELVREGPKAKKEVPTLEQFAPRFLEGYARANRQKPSGIAGKQTILKVHLVPVLGSKKLDAITNEDVQRLKRHLAAKAAKRSTTC